MKTHCGQNKYFFLFSFQIQLLIIKDLNKKYKKEIENLPSIRIKKNLDRMTLIHYISKVTPLFLVNLKYS